MPLRRGDVKSSLRKKGFVEDVSGKHISYSYDMSNGIKTRIKTYVSHGRESEDLDDFLVSKMAKQINLTKREFGDFVSCKMKQPKYEAIVKEKIKKGLHNQL